MNVMTAVATWAALAWSGLTSASAPRDLLRLDRSDEAMGSTVSIVLYGTDRPRLEAAADAALDEVHRLDRLLSNYQRESEWSEVNRSAATQAVKVSAELFELLSECLRYSRESDGAFDITVAPLVRVWGFYRDEGRLPGTGEVAAARSRVGYRYVRLDRVARTVRFDRLGVELDPGGIGKGYAVDRMVDILRQRGADTALVSVSGSSIFGMGAPPEEPEGWRIAIRAPGDPHQAAAEVLLKDLSLSTSGSYEKFFRAHGRTYSHIVDPRTGYPARGASSVSVLARRTIDSEAWTKPYFVNGRAWTATHKRREQRVFYCDDAMPAACRWIE